jgi:hypothetical protein
MYVYIDDEFDLNAQFWNILDGVVELLEPLQIATDVCQTDAATM